MARQYKAAGRQVICGMVLAKINDKGYKQRYLKANCGGVENEPAKLHLFKDADSAARGDASLLEISFAKVDYVKADPKENITIKHEGKVFCFQADSKQQKLWIKYCFLLNSIPNYSIPEEPKFIYNNKFTKKLEKNANIWVVFIVDTGVGHDCDCRGLHFIDFHNKDQAAASIRILNVHTEKCLHIWNKSKLRICGRIGCLVYVEVVRLGLLWMSCPDSSASEVIQCLHKLLYDHPQTSSDETTRSVDSGIASLRESPELINNSPHLCNTITSSNGLRSSLNHNFERSSFDHDFERSDDDSEAYDTANSDENDDDCFIDSGCFQDCTKDIKTTNHISSSPTSISSGVTHYRNSNYCAHNECAYCNRTSHSIFEQSCQLSISSAYRRHKQIADMSPSLSSLVIHDGSKNGRSTSTCYQYNNDFYDSAAEKRQKTALQKNYAVLIEKIDIGSLLPHLVTMDLLTDDDKEVLMNVTRTRTDRIHHLIDVLPRKAFGWFDNFLECLQRSTSGTGHADIIKRLSITYDLL